MKMKQMSISLILILMIGCSAVESNKEAHTNKVANLQTVSTSVIFRAFSANDQQPLKDVRIIIIDQNGENKEQLVTNDQGEAEKVLTVPVDQKYKLAGEQNIELRGTVTVIASKEGYRDTVILETPVSKASAAQPFYMEPIVPEERNEPTIQLGNNHRLEIISLVDKYKE